MFASKKNIHPFQATRDKIRYEAHGTRSWSMASGTIASGSKGKRSSARIFDRQDRISDYFIVQRCVVNALDCVDCCYAHDIVSVII
jgi:hypothetical protein